jgi:hypothetical protein
MKPPIRFGGNLALADWREIVVQALRLERFKCNNISKYGTREQYSKKKSGLFNSNSLTYGP